MEYWQCVQPPWVHTTPESSEAGTGFMLQGLQHDMVLISRRNCADDESEEDS